MLVNKKINFVRKELTVRKAYYARLKACLSGDLYLKSESNCTLFLPVPPAFKDAELSDAYKFYVSRAVFYNATLNTLNGLVGEVQASLPEIEIPDRLQNFINNTDGNGLTLSQLAKKGLRQNAAYGHGGFLVDYPYSDEKPLSAAESNKLDPIIKNFRQTDIVNWREETINGRLKLTLVVLREVEEVEKDCFELAEEVRYRVLKIGPSEDYFGLNEETGEFATPELEPDKYTVEIYGDKNKEGEGFELLSQVQPRDYNGNKFDSIQFFFYGADDNNATPDYPPLYDLASLNLAHFANSADYEDSCWLAGQLTPVFTGLTEEWVNNVLKGQIQLGTRNPIPLPVGAAVDTIQGDENTMPMEAMTHKEKLMVALGARYVEQPTVEKTATQSTYDQVSTKSTLASVADNFSAALTLALRSAASFVGNFDENEIKFKYNTDFAINKLSKEDREAVIQDWMNSAISWDEMRATLRKSNLVLDEDEKAKAAINEDKKANLELIAKSSAAENNSEDDENDDKNNK